MFSLWSSLTCSFNRCRNLFVKSEIKLKEGRRTYRRIPLSLQGHFLDDEFDDHPMSSSDISCGGANITAKHIPPIGAKLVLYFDDLGRVPGTVIRQTGVGFVVCFKLSTHKKTRVADQLTWLWNRDTLGLSEERTSQRYEAGGVVKVCGPDGREYSCRVIDISLSGSALAHDGKVFEIGEIISIGKVKGEVVRTEDSHFAVRYLI